MGGTPVDRFSSQGMVDQVVALFNSHDDFMLGLAPEGTRQRVNSLRTGFYHIAKKAGVPIVPIGFDYSTRTVVIGEPFFAGEDEETDLAKIIAFYAQITGRNPALDLRHLKDQD
jgi:1-acyl-sn-glycerol-3-phosphate acyltransferase